MLRTREANKQRIRCGVRVAHASLADFGGRETPQATRWKKNERKNTHTHTHTHTHTTDTDTDIDIDTHTHTDTDTDTNTDTDSPEEKHNQ